MGNVIMHPEFERLCKKCQGAVKQLSMLICEYDEMVFQHGPLLEAKYVEAFGALDMAVYEAYVKIAYLKRKIDLTQACLNRNEQPDLTKIEDTLQTEFESYQKELQRLARKMTWAKALLECKSLSMEETKRLKELYRELARGLHPDLNQNQTDEVQGLWNRVQKAYKEGDLSLMESLYEIFQAMKDKGADSQAFAEDAFEVATKRYKKIKEQVDGYLAKIAGLEKEFPFKFVDMLADEKQVKEHMEELKSQARGYEEQIKQLQGYLDLLLAPAADVMH